MQALFSLSFSRILHSMTQGCLQRAVWEILHSPTEVHPCVIQQGLPAEATHSAAVLHLAIASQTLSVVFSDQSGSFQSWRLFDAGL
jgi:hypothetical protein